MKNDNNLIIEQENQNQLRKLEEFYVNDFCSRDSCTQRVYVNSIEKKPLIEHLKKKFVEEARAIAQMDHDNIIKVQTIVLILFPLFLI